MIVTCPNCSTRYNLPDDKVPAGGAKVKCSKCAHVFKAEHPPATPEEEVESLLEDESPATDTQAGDDFDETFDDVAGGGDAPADEPVPEEEPADEPPIEEPAPPAEEPAAEAPEDDMPGMDDLFDESDDEEVPAPEEEAAPSDDVGEDLFGDDDGDDLFADVGEGDSDGDDIGDLFDDDSDEAEDDTAGDDDAGDVGDLFEDDDDDEEDDEDYEDDDEYEGDDDFGLDDEPEKGNKKSIGCLIIILVVAVAIAAGVYFKAWTYLGIDVGNMLKNVPFVGQMFMEETGGDGETAPGESPADRVSNIELKNVKQYYVANEKAGNLFVVEGKAVNKFSSPKEQIKVEVVLYDGVGKVLASQAFLCGNVLSQFQLQVQTEKEIKDGLESQVGILSNNTFIRPGASTPFMAVFFQPPAGVKEFLVKVVDVGDPE